ncbi:hypothetical protein BRC60_03240 [Halobacteriales archaeon QH_1_68_42]|nr:MAG: hypothetical protein BRC60_03240 [Halobacteriales archaeon QH_1_68_42]
MQAAWVSALPLGLLQKLLLVGAVVASLAVVRRLSDGPRWGDVLRRRFVLGVPWGTLLTVFGVLLVYWVLQGGWANPRDPVVIPFRSWSYLYPVGMLVAGFGHSGVGHITGNLLATAAFAPVVEFAVPAGSLLAGLFTGIFSLGPVIGFSGVVFAYFGFALVTRPLLAVVAILGSDVVSLFYRSFRFPYITREAQPGFFSPWYADVAIQGHAIGILLGIVLGVAFLRRRDERPNPLYLWVAALLFAVSENLWALYTPVGASEYALFRAVGLSAVLLFAALVVSAVAASDRPLVPAADASDRSRLPRLPRMPDVDTPSRRRTARGSRRFRARSPRTPKPSRCATTPSRTSRTFPTSTSRGSSSRSRRSGGASTSTPGRRRTSGPAVWSCSASDAGSGSSKSPRGVSPSSGTPRCGSAGSGGASASSPHATAGPSRATAPPTRCTFAGTASSGASHTGPTG